MLQTVLEHIHNMFNKPGIRGTYTISGGMLSLHSVKDGQRFWITGSDLNDGVYTYHENGIKNDDDTEAAGLRDETFDGCVCALAVPPAVIALAAEISDWVDNFGEEVNSPYQSENVIGVYSYTKASGGTGAGGSVSWQDVFASRLNRWRKLCI